jgi:hypothetical protein
MGPHLDERDARSLARHIVHELRSLGGHVEHFGVSLKHEGFTFRATINGADVWVRTGQGNFTYKAVAVELLNEALHHAREFADPELRITAH